MRACRAAARTHGHATHLKLVSLFRPAVSMRLISRGVARTKRQTSSAILQLSIVAAHAV